MRTIRAVSTCLAFGGLAMLAGPAAFAAPPANDSRSNASLLTVPTQVSNNLSDATSDPTDPFAFGCGPAPGRSVWYRLPAGRNAPTGLELRAAEGAGTLVIVYRREEGELRREACAATDRTGYAAFSFSADGDERYLVQVAAGVRADAGAFTLATFVPEPAPTLPGPLLPAFGGRGTVDSARDQLDAFSVRLREGVTYRYTITGPRACPVSAYLLRPGEVEANNSVRDASCGEYGTFTPGPGAGGRYSVLVQADRGARVQPYRLIVAPAGPDDLAPGTGLPLRRRVSGVVAGRGIDRVDVWSFTVERRSRIRLRLATSGGTDLQLYTQAGRRLKCACGTTGDQEIEYAAAPGAYVAVVRAQSLLGGRYRLLRTERTITTAQTLANGSRAAVVPTGSSVSLSVAVSPAPDGGLGRLDVEQFDPQEGWQFRRRFTVPVVGGAARVSWVVPLAGRWRIRGEYLGSPTDSPAPGGTARVTAR